MPVFKGLGKSLRRIRRCEVGTALGYLILYAMCPEDLLDSILGAGDGTPFDKLCICILRVCARIP